ncbi:MAG: DsbA family oxidoreductase [Pseudomonadota bacterium]
MRIDILSDVMCPWCYIGKRRLEAAMERSDLTFEIVWRPYKLDDTIPEGGMDRQAYLERKFGGPDGVQEVYGRITEAGLAEGISFRFEDIPRSPNTTNAHRLIRWAGAADAVDPSERIQDAVVERLFQSYFLEGGDVESPDALAHAASAATDADLGDIAARLQGPEDRDAVQAEIEHAKHIGVTGVPTFVLDSKLVVVGAHPPDVMLDAISQATATIN